MKMGPIPNVEELRSNKDKRIRLISGRWLRCYYHSDFLAANCATCLGMKRALMVCGWGSEPMLYTEAVEVLKADGLLDDLLLVQITGFDAKKQQSITKTKIYSAKKAALLLGAAGFATFSVWLGLRGGRVVLQYLVEKRPRKSDKKAKP